VWLVLPLFHAIFLGNMKEAQELKVVGQEQVNFTPTSLRNTNLNIRKSNDYLAILLRGTNVSG
jgi:hypothetical protein